MVGQTNINTSRVSDLNWQKINVVDVESLNKIISKFVAKLPKYRIMFKVIFTSLGLDYREASLITLYFVVLGHSIRKLRSIRNFITSLNMIKMNVHTIW